MNWVELTWVELNRMNEWQNERIKWNEMKLNEMKWSEWVSEWMTERNKGRNKGRSECINEWIHERNEGMNEWMNEWMNERNEWMSEWMNKEESVTNRGPISMGLCCLYSLHVVFKRIFVFMLFTLCLLHSYWILYLVLVSSSSVKCLSNSIVGLEVGSKSFVCKVFFQWFLHSCLEIDMARSKLSIYTYSCLCLCVDNS